MTRVTALIIVTSSEEATPGYHQRIPDKIMTPDSVSTPIGTLEFFDGMPTDSTLSKVCDNLDLMRGVESFLTGIPAASMEGLRLGFLQGGIDACTRSGSSRCWTRTRCS